MIEKDLGFVLKRRNFRETSLIANIYTLRFGKITGIFKGFYTPKKEFASSLDIFTLNDFIFYPKKREIWLVSFADLVHDYSFLRKDVSKASVAAAIFTVIDRAMPLWDSNAEVFNLLRMSLESLRTENESKLLYIFLIKFLTLSGIKPHLNQCVNCLKSVEGSVFFSVSRGGLLCTSCFKGRKDSQEINRDVASSLLYVQRNEFPMALRIKPTKRCEEEILYILHEFILYHLDLDISSYVPSIR